MIRPRRRRVYSLMAILLVFALCAAIVPLMAGGAGAARHKRYDRGAECEDQKDCHEAVYATTSRSDHVVVTLTDQCLLPSTRFSPGRLPRNLHRRDSADRL